MNKQPQVTAETRRRFKVAFCQQYCEKPIQKITVTSLVHQTGNDRSTFYLYFQDVYDLRAEVEEDVIARCEALIPHSPESSQREILQALVNVYTSSKLELRALLGDYGTQNFLQRFKHELISAALLTPAQRESTLADYYVEFHAATVISLFQLWIKRDEDLSPSAMFDLILSLYFEGMNGQMLP